MTVEVKEIKARLDHYPDHRALRLSSKDMFKINEIFRYIGMCYFNGKPVWTRKMREHFLGRTKQQIEIGNRYLQAAIKWLEEKGYITFQKMGPKKIWFPSDGKKLIAFLMAVDPELLRVIRRDILDFATEHFDLPDLLADILRVCNKEHMEEFIKKARKYSLVEKAILDRLDKRVTKYEAQIRKIKFLKSLFLIPL